MVCSVNGFEGGGAGRRREIEHVHDWNWNNDHLLQVVAHSSNVEPVEAETILASVFCVFGVCGTCGLSPWIADSSWTMEASSHFAGPLVMQRLCAQCLEVSCDC